LLQKAAPPVQRAGHRVTFMIIDTGVVHGTAKSITHRQSARFLPLAATHAT
jgi:hypothetical protein